MTQNETLTALQTIGAMAANLGAEYKAQSEAFTKEADKRKADADTAKSQVDADSRAVGGFDTFMFRGLSAVAKGLGQVYNDLTSAEAREGAELAARAFTASFTGATDKTAKGGTASGYVTHILLGANGDHVRRSLQARLAFHYESVEAAGNDAKARAAAKAKADRYTVVCGNAPNADGSIPLDKSGKPMPMRHMGRPAATVSGIAIPAGRGTDRKAQFAALSSLYATHGQVVLSPEFLDAFLDNGGKYQAEVGVAQLAGEARAAIEDMLAKHGGATSGDAAALTVMVATLSRIAANGFKSSHVVSAVPDVVVGTSEDEDSAGGAESEGAAEADKPRRQRRAATGGL